MECTCCGDRFWWTVSDFSGDRAHLCPSDSDPIKVSAVDNAGACIVDLREGAVVGKEAAPGLLVLCSHSMDAEMVTLGNGTVRALDETGGRWDAGRFWCDAASTLSVFDDIIVLSGGLPDDAFSLETGDRRNTSLVETSGACLDFRRLKSSAGGFGLLNENPAAGSSWDDTGRVKTLS